MSHAAVPPAPKAGSRGDAKRLCPLELRARRLGLATVVADRRLASRSSSTRRPYCSSVCAEPPRLMPSCSVVRSPSTQRSIQLASLLRATSRSALRGVSSETTEVPGVPPQKHLLRGSAIPPRDDLRNGVLFTRLTDACRAPAQRRPPDRDAVVGHPPSPFPLPPSPFLLPPSILPSPFALRPSPLFTRTSPPRASAHARGRWGRRRRAVRR